MDFMNESMRSDLVIEYAERFYNSSEHDGRQLPGVEFDEGVESEHRIKVTDVKIVDEEGEKVIVNRWDGILRLRRCICRIEMMIIIRRQQRC